MAKNASLVSEILSAILNVKKSVPILNTNEGKRTEIGEIPNTLIQKCNTISYKGGLLPPLRWDTMSLISICAWKMENGSSNPIGEEFKNIPPMMRLAIKMPQSNTVLLFSNKNDFKTYSPLNCA